MSKKKELWSTYRGNNDFPVYNWFYFTEAFSRGLVRNIILKYVQKEKARVLDPFCGTGTTLLVAKEFGFDAEGTDVSPLMCLLSKAKTNNYNTESLSNKVSKILEFAKTKNITAEKTWIKKFFYADNLNDLYKLKTAISELDILDTEKDFFNIVLLRTLQGVTKSTKQGSSIKMKKIEKKDVFHIFEKISNNFIKDLNKFYKKAKPTDVKILNTNILDTKLSNNYDLIITSPPYLNKTEYTRRMGLELEFLGYESILKEHLGTKKAFEEKEWIYKKHFEQLRIYPEDYKMYNENYDFENYFKSLETTIEKLKSHLNKNGILTMVIAGGCFPDKPVDIYHYMQALYRANGLDIIDLKIDREIQCHGKHRTNKTGLIKEFTIVGRKM